MSKLLKLIETGAKVCLAVTALGLATELTGYVGDILTSKRYNSEPIVVPYNSTWEKIGDYGTLTCVISAGTGVTLVAGGMVLTVREKRRKK